MKNSIYWLKRIRYLLGKGQFIDSVAQHRRAKRIAPPDTLLPKIEINQLTDTSEPKLTEEVHNDGNVSLEELRCIAKLVKYYQPKNIFEIGTFDGRTTLNMALNAPNSIIHTLDLPKSEVHSTAFRIKKGDVKFIDKPASGLRFNDTQYATNIRQIYADSAKYDYSELNNTMDLVFVDGAHTYDYVVNDTEIAKKLLRNDKGIIIWHDYSWKEVVQALNEYYQNDDYFFNMKHIAGTTLVVLERS